MANTPTTTLAPTVPAKPATVPPNVAVTAAREASSVGIRHTESNDLMDPNIVAKPLSNPGDGFGSLRPKNPDVVFRGILRELQNNLGVSPYMRFEQAKAQGFVVATKEDVDPSTPIPPSCITADGKIINGDLILMKISAAAYRGALKYKDQQAINSVKRSQSVEGARKEINRVAQETNMPSKLSRKLDPFNPSLADLPKGFDED